MIKNFIYKIFACAVLITTATSFPVHAQPFTLPISLQPTQDEFDRFTIENSNNDIKTWSYDATENNLYYTASATKDADDWLFIPVTLSEKDTYLKVSVEALASGAAGWYDENFELAIGASASSSSMRTILTKTVDQDVFTAYETTFSNDIPGPAWLGIHATSPKNRRTLKMCHITLQSYATPIPQTPVIKESQIDGLEYSATITMPTMSVQGDAINGKVNLRFNIDGETVKNFTNLTPGTDVPITATLSKGEHHITYIAFMTTDGETTESKPMSETVKAVNLNAQYALPFIFGPMGQEDFDECKIIDSNVDETTWKLEYLTPEEPAFFYGWHSKNQANDWIILPAVDFGHAKKITISTESRSKGTYTEAFEVWLGRDATINDMSIKVIDVTSLTNNQEWTLDEETLDIDGGIWYAGIHVKSPADSYGLYLRNLKIENAEEVITGVENIDTQTIDKEEYFNLQGMKLINPEKGQLVIMRMGNKSYKVIFK